MRCRLYKAVLLLAPVCVQCWLPTPGILTNTRSPGLTTRGHNAWLHGAPRRAASHAFSAPEDTDVGGDGSTATAPASKKRSPEAERLALEAEKYKLMAEQLRLEAEKEKLVLEVEQAKKQDAVVAKQDRTIAIFQAALKEGEGRLAEVVKENLSSISAEIISRLNDDFGSSEELAQREGNQDLSAAILKVVEELDPKAATKLNNKLREKLQREQDILNAAKKRLDIDQADAFGRTKSQRGMVDEWVEASTNGTQVMGMGMNNTQLSPEQRAGMAGNIVVLPLWVPTPLLRYIGAAPPLRQDDIEKIREEVFGMDNFFVTSVEPSTYAVMYKGNPRMEDSAAVCAAVNERLQAIPGVKDRVQLFFMLDPTPPMMNEGEQPSEPRPVFIAISAEAQPRQSNVLTYLLSGGTVLVSAFTCFAYAIGNFALNTEFFKKITEGDASVAYSALPIAAGILALQVFHEIGHKIAAEANDQELALPVIIPSLQVGNFGAVTSFLSFPKSRKTLFDVSVSGPIVGIAASMAAFVVSLTCHNLSSSVLLTWHTPPSSPVVPAALFHSSLLIGSITATVLPSVMTQALSLPVPIHPLVVIGVTGVLVNALNLMPIGRLDGGRASMAVLGRRTSGLVGTLTLGLQALSAVFNNYSLQLFWGLVVILTQRMPDIPAVDEVTEVDNTRTAVTISMQPHSSAHYGSHCLTHCVS
ncbi:unnamed protein product [Chrysoparadoxa australica]